MNSKRINWQTKCREAEGLLKIARDGNAILQNEMASGDRYAKEQYKAYDERLASHVCPKSKWYEGLTIWALVLSLSVVMGAIYGVVDGEKTGATEIPHETIRYVVKANPILVAHDKACTEWYLRKESHADN